MIKRTIEISRERAHLTTRHSQLLVKHDKTVAGSIPCEDIGMLVVDHSDTTYSHSALTSLVNAGAAMVVCGRDHLPAGILLPLPQHSTVVWRINQQINAPRPLVKQLWKQIVQVKICNQAAVLDPDCSARKKLVALARTVRSGDTSNVESQAARVYWKNFLPDEQRFYRDQNGDDGLNCFLNYGYAIVRAAIARALVSAGLLTAFGLHHRNRSNAFCLADDLIEPFRPVVDYFGRDLHEQGYSELTPEAKRVLLELLTFNTSIGSESRPMLIAIQKMVSSLVNCFCGDTDRLVLPEFADVVETTVNQKNSGKTNED